MKRYRIQYVAIAAGLIACASWYPKERGQRLEERVDRIEGEGAAAQQAPDRAAAQEQARRLNARIDDLQKKIDAMSADAAARRGAGDKTAAADEKLAAELSRLRAALDGQERRLDAMEKRMARTPPAGGERVAEQRKPPRPPAAEARPGTVADARPAPHAGSQPEATPSGKGDVLAMARDQELRGQKDVARDLYQEYVAKFPADPNAAEAHFRLGELAFGDRRWRDALREYGLVVKDFPQSARAPAALLQTAESMLRLDMKDDAVALLTEIPKRYPATPSATRARQRYAELTGAGGQATGTGAAGR